MIKETPTQRRWRQRFKRELGEAKAYFADRLNFYTLNPGWHYHYNLPCYLVDPELEARYNIKALVAMDHLLAERGLDKQYISWAHISNELGSSAVCVDPRFDLFDNQELTWTVECPYNSCRRQGYEWAVFELGGGFLCRKIAQR